MRIDQDPAAGILSRLRADPLRHIVTLKMLHMHGDTIRTIPLEDESGWALLSMFPVHVSEFDRQTYPGMQQVILIDGTSERNKLKLLRGLPAQSVVVKTYDDAIKKYLVRQLDAEPALSFLSFTGSPGGTSGTPMPGLIESTSLNDEAVRLFGYNGYEPAKLDRYFADGARWFGVRAGGRIVSVCFVFRNFETVWEIGGVFTELTHRRQGLARGVVSAALNHLLTVGLTPRYQVRSDNVESIRLAETAGLKEFLRMSHYLVHREGPSR